MIARPRVKAQCSRSSRARGRGRGQGSGPGAGGRGQGVSPHSTTLHAPSCHGGRGADFAVPPPTAFVAGPCTSPIGEPVLPTQGGSVTTATASSLHGKSSPAWSAARSRARLLAMAPSLRLSPSGSWELLVLFGSSGDELKSTFLVKLRKQSHLAFGEGTSLLSLPPRWAAGGAFAGWAISRTGCSSGNLAGKEDKWLTSP